MAKQVLGRNLGALLDGGTKKAGDPFASRTTPVGSGVRSLMNGPQAAAAMPPSAEFPRRSAIPAWYLFGGDILLAGLAVVVVCKSSHPLSWQKELFCAAAIALGGCLGLGAVLLADQAKAKC